MNIADLRSASADLAKARDAVVAFLDRDSCDGACACSLRAEYDALMKAEADAYHAYRMVAFAVAV